MLSGALRDRGAPDFLEALVIKVCMYCSAEVETEAAACHEKKQMNYLELDTPSLLVEQSRMMKNLHKMQDYADAHHVNLRPHTKTHKMPELALLQEKLGASGITVAKVGEAEVMAGNGLKDIFIANEIVGETKLRRIRELARSVRISFGIDSVEQVQMIESVFAGEEKPARVLAEIEVGENRSGVITKESFELLLSCLKKCRHINLIGVFSHDGDSYGAETVEIALERSVRAQIRTLEFAEMARERGFDISVVSVGSTPSMANGSEIVEGVTEIRPGTYIFMDASQGHAVGDMSCCAATVLATVMSKPTDTRVILDVGAKGLTMQHRDEGICATPGLGTIYEYPDTHIYAMYDEHAIIYDRHFHDSVKIGDKVRIIMVHICPVVNLYDRCWLIDDNGEVIKSIPIECRGKLQ